MKIINKIILIFLINIQFINGVHTPEFVKNICTKINEIHPILIPLISLEASIFLGFIERESYKKKTIVAISITTISIINFINLQTEKYQHVYTTCFKILFPSLLSPLGFFWGSILNSIIKNNKTQT